MKRGDSCGHRAGARALKLLLGKGRKGERCMKLIAVILLLVCLLTGCQQRESSPRQEEKILIGFSQVERENPWRTAQINSFRVACNTDYSRLIYHQPLEYTTQWQVADCEKLIEEGVNYLVIAPNEPSALKDVLRKAREKDIRVILMQNDPDGLSKDDYASLVFTDYQKEGELCAQMLLEVFGEKTCSIVEVCGTQSSPVAKARAAGFRKEIEKHKNMKIVYSAQGNFNRVTAQKAMEDAIIDLKKNGTDIDAVFAHSDEDGLGTLQALKTAGFKPGQNVQIVSINGIQDVCKAIIAGEYLGTVESNPKWGQVVMALVDQIERGVKPFPSVMSPYRIINSENAAEIFYTAY